MQHYIIGMCVCASGKVESPAVVIVAWYEPVQCVQEGLSWGWGDDAPWKKELLSCWCVCICIWVCIFFAFAWGVDLRWGQGAALIMLVGLPSASWDLQEPAADMTVTNRCATNSALIENNLKKKRKKWGQIGENGGKWSQQLTCRWQTGVQQTVHSLKTISDTWWSHRTSLQASKLC